MPPGVLQTDLKQTTSRFRFIAAVAETAELLRESYWARDGSFADVAELLYGLEPQFQSQPQWREIVEMVTRAQRLTMLKLAR